MGFYPLRKLPCTDIESPPVNRIPPSKPLRKSGILRATRDHSNCYYTVERKDPLGLLKQRLINAYYLTLKEIEPFMADSRRLEKIKKECNADCKVHIKKRGGRKNEKV